MTAANFIAFLLWCEAGLSGQVYEIMPAMLAAILFFVAARQWRKLAGR